MKDSYNMSNDLELLFTEAIAEGAGDADEITLEEFTNAEINMGDNDDFKEVEVDEEPAEDDDTDVSEISEVEDVDDDSSDDTDDGATDESEFDWATVKDQKVTIKVAGQESEVTLDELRNGYMRQADYTRGTQQVAELRKQAEWAVQVQNAFTSDPQGTLEYLARQSGVQLQVVPADDPYSDIDPELQPLVRTIQEQKQMLEQMQQHQTRAQAQAQERAEQEQFLREAERELWDTKQEFPDMVEREVLEFAADQGVGIREAYLLIQAETLLAEKKAATAARAKADQNATKIAAKRAQAGKTLKGASAAGKAASNDPEFDTFEQMLAYEMSK